MQLKTLSALALLAFSAGPYGLVPHGLAHVCEAAHGQNSPDSKEGPSPGVDHCALCKVLSHSGGETPPPVVRVGLDFWVLSGSAPADERPVSGHLNTLGPRGPPAPTPDHR